jgi:hypothetical protein
MAVMNDSLGRVSPNKVEKITRLRVQQMEWSNTFVK